MQKSNLLIIGFLLVLLVGGFAFNKLYSSNQEKKIASTTPKKAVVTVHVIGTGFSPDQVTIKKGDTVAWVNDDKQDYHWPASDLHPTHELYPEFDPKEPISSGEGWSFTFEKVGTWHYHDHLRPNKKGTVIVQSLP